jgi:two-component system, OmpR family, sensor histidine kinase MtrB
MAGRPFVRFGLRARITIAFALGGLLLSTLLAVVTLTLTRQQLLDDAEDSAQIVSINNASRLRNNLTPTTDLSDVQTILGTLTRPEGASTLIRLNGEWLPDPEFTPDQVPPAMLAGMQTRGAQQMRVRLGGDPTLLVGIPIPGFDLQFIQAVPLSSVESSLDTLRLILVAAGGLTTGLAAVFGWWASRRTLLPLRRVGEAARAIAEGQLDTRLDEPADRDLAVLATAFNDMAGALQNRIERDARFASEVSHELRSPLMTLTASVAVLEGRRDELPERARTALDLLSTDLDRFQALVQDLLEISRFDAGAARLDLSTVRVVEFVREAVATTSHHGIPIRHQPGVELVGARVDKRRMVQVVTNLVDNARKYGGGPTGIEIVAHGDTVEIAVEDEGPGVPPEEREVVFDRFSRGSAGGRRGDDTGTGLGLALVDEHVRLHGGRVWVTDRPGGGHGARFVVELPLHAAADDVEEVVV